MAQIQEYTPQVQQPEPIAAPTPNMDLVGAQGRSLQNLGGEILQAGAVIHRRQAQAETADIYADFADKRATYTAKLQQQIQDGTLDVDKFAQEFDDQTSQAQDKIETAEGRNFFERQQSRLKSQLIQHATAGAAQIAANEAKGKWKSGMDLNSSALMSDPTSFQDVYEQGVESVDHLISSGGLPEKFRDQAIQQMGTEYAKGAVRGWAELDPDKAKHMLDQGAFDQFFNSDQKHQMLAEVNHYAGAKEVEQRRTEKAVKDAKDAASDKWFNDNYEKIENGSLSTKDVLNAQKSGVIDWQDAERANRMIDVSTKKENKTDPRIKNQLIQRIVNPDSQNPIDTSQDLMPYVGKGISISDFNSMNSLLNKTPEQQAMHQGEKAMFDSMRKTIRFKNMMTNQYDLLGEQKLAKAMSDYSQAKADIKKNGGNLGDLVNPNSPLYFGNRLQDYQTSMQDQMAHVSQDRTDKALGTRPPEDSPTGKEPAPVNKNVRQKNESPADYLKRLGR